MPSVYPGALDDFSESSPTYMSDPDATGRVHSTRHDDVESAVEQVQETLGVNPQGSSPTVAAKLAAYTKQDGGYVAPMRVQSGEWTNAIAIQTRALDDALGGLLFTNAANDDLAMVRVDTRYSAPLLVMIANGKEAVLHGDDGSLSLSGRKVPTHYWDESVGRRLFVWDTINNRWQMVYGDTGWRRVDTENGWQGPAGGLQIRRVGSFVYARTMNYADGIGATADTIYSLPLGFRLVGGYTNYIRDSLSVAANAYMEVSTALKSPMRGSLIVNGSWTTQDGWPSSLPGTDIGGIPTLYEGETPDPATLDIDPEIPTGLTPDDDTSGWTVEYPDGPTP